SMLVSIGIERKEWNRALDPPTHCDASIAFNHLSCRRSAPRDSYDERDQDSHRKLRIAERINGRSLARPLDTDARRGGLVSRWLQERDTGPDGFRASVRARDVHRFRPCAVRLARQVHGRRWWKQQRNNVE